MADFNLPLEDVIQALRQQIEAGIANREQHLVAFGVGKIDVEFNVVAKREGGPKGAIKFSVLGVGAELGADAKFAREMTQKIKLTLTPMERQPDGTYKSDFLISRTPEA